MPDQSRPIVPSGPVDGEIQAPPSKSLTIRGLAAAALASGRSALREPLVADDTRRMADALERLGIRITRRGGSMIVEGAGGAIQARGASLDLGHAGTPLRLLTAICCLGSGRFLLDGSARMRQRPVADLIEALRALGVLITSLNGDGCPPVEIVADGFRGGAARLRGDVSSQYLSALLMIGPCAAEDLTISLDNPPVSRPYVDLTLQVMEAFGAAVERTGYTRFRVAAGHGYEARVFPVEGDASSASYFFAAAAITGGRVRVTGIPPSSRQGDLVFLDLLETMGCRVARGPSGLTVEAGPLRGIDTDLSGAPDLAPSLAAVALFAEGPTRLRGVAHLRQKESDRMETVAACVRSLGGTAEIGPAELIVRPPPGGRSSLRGASIDPREDHRIAMAFAVAGLAVPGISILNDGCVAKSFPDFFDRLRDLTGR